MRRALMLVLVVALGALVFAPAALAQDDNPTGDDPGASSTSSATASATSTASATATPEASPSADAGVLPSTGGLPLLAVAAGVLLIGGGFTATMLLRRTS